LSLLVDEAIDKVAKDKSRLQQALAAIKTASPSLQIMVKDLGITGTVFFDDGTIDVQPVKDWLDISDVKIFAVHEITIMTRYKGTETALRATVSFTFLNKQYDLAAAFSIDPFKLIGQMFSYGWDLLKLWIVGTPMPERDLRDFGLDAGADSVITPVAAAAAALGAGRGLIGELPAAAVCSSASPFVDLSRNAYTGTIPSCFVSGARPVLLSRNKLSGEVPTLGARLKSVRLSHNDLSGDVSLAVASVEAAREQRGAIRFLDVSHNPRMGGRVEDVLVAAGNTLKHLDVSHTSVDSRGDAAAAAAITSSSLTSYAVAGAKFVPVNTPPTSAASEGGRRAVHVAVHLAGAGSRALCGDRSQHSFDGHDCASLRSARRGAIAAVQCAVRTVAEEATISAAGAGHAGNRAVKDVRVDRVTPLEDGGAVASFTVLLEHNLGVEQSSTDAASAWIVAAISAHLAAASAGLDISDECATAAAAAAADVHQGSIEISFLKKTTRSVVSAALPGCASPGAMGERCDYVCPATWHRFGGHHAAAEQSSVGASVLGMPRAHRATAPEGYHFGGSRANAKKVRPSADAAFASDEKKKANDKKKAKYKPGDKMHPHFAIDKDTKDMDLAKARFAVHIPAEGRVRHVPSGGIGGCSAGCRYHVKYAVKACDAWAHDKGSKAKHASCRAAMNMDVPQSCGVDRNTCPDSSRADSAYFASIGRAASALSASEACEPCGYILHYNSHDIEGHGRDSHYEMVNTRVVREEREAMIAAQVKKAKSEPRFAAADDDFAGKAASISTVISVAPHAAAAVAEFGIAQDSLRRQFESLDHVVAQTFPSCDVGGIPHACSRPYGGAVQVESSNHPLLNHPADRP
jgi:hypothetical protein